MTGRASLSKHPPGGDRDIPLACLGYHAAMRWILTVVLLMASALASALPTADPPATDDVSGLINQPAPGWKLEHWFNSEPLGLEDLRGKVVLVRWVMAPSCPLCSATAPALNRFDEEYRGRGLVVIGVYHHKDPEPLDVETVRGYVEHYQFRFPVAVDPDWQTEVAPPFKTEIAARISGSLHGFKPPPRAAVIQSTPHRACAGQAGRNADGGRCRTRCNAQCRPSLRLCCHRRADTPPRT